MSPKKGAKLLGEPSGNQNYGATEESPVLCRSAEAVLEPSKDPSRLLKPSNQNKVESSDSPSLTPWRTLVTHSDPLPDLTRTISAYDLLSGQASEQSTASLEGSAFCALLIGYKNAAIRLRNSKFIYIFQFLFSIIPISALVMGVIYAGQCDADFSLPGYGAFTGVFGILLAALWMSFGCWGHRGTFVADVAFLFLLICFVLFVVADMCVFGSMSPSFEPGTSNYCDRTFYDYSFYKHIARGAVAALALGLYLPGSSFRMCRHCILGREEEHRPLPVLPELVL